jgi:hypothetical protein
MKKKMIFELLKYVDCFGTKFNFYTDKKRKFYTPLGGILSILAFIFACLIFVFLNIEDFLRTSPITTTSVIRENYINVRFLEEKIWIPWRIRDYNNRKINHTNLFYPIIYYYQGKKNETTQGMDLTYNVVGYKLCNETSMVNRSNLYMINISLDNLYCIDMDELLMGGNWQANFINYIEFDLYICKDGINYNETDKDCSSYGKIMNASTEDNSFEMEFFYPVVYYQPTNKSTPIVVKYTSNFYLFSRYSNKIDRLFLQKYILIDDDGWLGKSITNYSYWGYSSLSGDSYTTGEEKDLMNEGSSSRLYSFNIYLNADIICYNRYYKKMFIIIADRLPIVNIICVFFSLVAKVFKISSGNKKLTELLFENLKEKPNIHNKINNEQFNILKTKAKSNHISIKKLGVETNLSNNNLSLINNINNINNNINNNIEKIINAGNTTNNNINVNDVSSSFIHLSPQHIASKRISNVVHLEKRKSSLDSKNGKSKFYKKAKKNKNNFSNIISNNSFNNNFNLNYGPVGVNNNNININIHNNLRNYDSNKSEDISSKHQSSKLNIKKRMLSEGKSIIQNNNKRQVTKTKKKYVKVNLFPYKYYLFSIFIKNFNIKKKSIFFTKKFLDVYNFICQLFDISSYLILQREFQIIKNTLMRGKIRALIENRQKINVNDHSFYNDMKECLDYQKFSILGRVKNPNDNNINRK